MLGYTVSTIDYELRDLATRRTAFVCDLTRP
jgi:hypothetical protein